MEGLGYQVIAISGDPPEKADEIVEKQELGYRVVVDPELKVTRQYGIVFRFGEGRMLPVPAVFLVGKDGTIRFHYVHPNYRIRLDTDLLLAAARVGIKE